MEKLGVFLCTGCEICAQVCARGAILTREEVLLREALRQGLQWSDYRVRRRLVRMMRGAFTESVAEPYWR